MLERWKRAVVNLEGATDSIPFSTRKNLLRHISELDEEDRTIVNGRDVRSSGTALYLADGENRYLLTARHVLFDEFGAKHEIAEETERCERIFSSGHISETDKESRLNDAARRASNKILPILFRVTGYDELSKFGIAKEHLSTLSAGVSWMLPYSFSLPAIDLGIISLRSWDRRTSGFRDELDARGYMPIDISNIGSEPEAEGDEVFTVGYPGKISERGKLRLHPAQKHWSSEQVSIPVSSFGRVSMLHPTMHSFLGDISIFPGNSGGPVISKDKLVGIVSAQYAISTEKSLDEFRVPMAVIIKASNIFDLLEEQKEKDNYELRETQQLRTGHDSK